MPRTGDRRVSTCNAKILLYAGTLYKLVAVQHRPVLYTQLTWLSVDLCDKIAAVTVAPDAVGGWCGGYYTVYACFMHLSSILSHVFTMSAHLHMPQRESLCIQPCNDSRAMSLTRKYCAAFTT